MSAVFEVRPLVLVVDDDDSVRRLVNHVLRDHFDVVEASNAAEALEVVKARPVEVVVLDVMMPGMSGLQACPLLKATARGQLPVLLLTALDDQASRNQGLEAGADDYLSKPVNRRELQLRVQNFVRLRRQEQLIRQQLESLSQLEALKDDLTALLVHDLRNPLTAVKSACQMLEPNVAPADRAIFELGAKALERVMESVSDLLKVRMLEQGHLTLERTPCDLDALTRDTVQTLQAAALDRKVEVTVASEGDVHAQVDPKLLRRVLENLLINAFRHTKRTVEVRVRGLPAAVELSVTDHGPGVPDFLKGEVFDMFGSLALKQSGERRGHGLGLYLVRLVARAHGGEVAVRDFEGGGAVFVVTLPRAAPGAASA